MFIKGKLRRDLLEAALDESRDGVLLVDAQKAGFPIVLANRGFEQISGYTGADVLGKSFPLLAGDDIEQPELAALQQAMTGVDRAQFTLRNYRKNGALFWNELSLAPVVDENQSITHYILILRDVTARILLDQHMHQSQLDLPALKQQLHTLEYTDPLIGISNRHRFDEQCALLWSTAQRTHSEFSLLMVDMDHFAQFNVHYGQSAGDECLRIVGDSIAKSFARTSDCAARYTGARFAVVTLGGNLEELRRHARKLADRVRGLSIPHGGSPHGVVTITIGGICRVPQREHEVAEMAKIAEVALLQAKQRGRDQINVVG